MRSRLGLQVLLAASKGLSGLESDTGSRLGDPERVPSQNRSPPFCETGVVSALCSGWSESRIRIFTNGANILLAGITAVIMHQIIPLTHRVTVLQRRLGPNTLNLWLCSFRGRRTVIAVWRWSVSWET